MLVVFAVTAAVAALGQQAPSSETKSLKILCLDPEGTARLLDYGEPAARLLDRAGAWVYEVSTGPEGWILMLRNGPDSACIIARGESYVLRESPKP